jgi:transcriptional regulator GlxA family with amidase domain
LKREIIYRLLSSVEGPLFYQNAILNPQTVGIGKAIHWIRENYRKDFASQQLARMSNMSVSSLQHKFKGVMSLSPVQYQKRLRLQEARRLLMNSTLDATTVALEVGYESPSQFSREYRRLFGLPPLKDIRAVQKTWPLKEV